MQSQLIKPIILAGIMLTLSCIAQAAEKVVVVPLFSATGDATTADVLAGKTFSNATGKGLTGTLSLDPATGDATTADVLVGKTFSNATANGLSGTRNPAPPAATGQTATNPIAAPAGSDGDLEKGISVTTRFTDNGNGTVTDNLTGLVWLQDASCADFAADKDTWANALTAANALFDDVGGDCGLTDGSVAGDWRLPNLFELESLRDLSETAPPLTPGHPFTGVMATGGLDSYWTSTTLDSATAKAWIVGFADGAALFDLKTTSYYIWPVRDAN